MSLKVKESILEIQPYVQGKSALDGIQDPIKLSSNESSFGPSPDAKEAYAKNVSILNRYPDGGQVDLREAIAEVYSLPAEQIICGNGSEELLQLLIRAYVCEGEEVLLSENGFLMCRIHSLAQGAKVVIAPEKNYLIDVDALLARVTDKTRLVIIANPNNPTGTYIPISEVRRLHESLPDHVLLVLDGAYAEYVMREDYDSGADLVAAHGNVVMTRTFSKIYGLSALRIGWAYCPPSVIDILQRIRTPFNTNSAALAAATAAVRDVQFTAMVCQHNETWLQRFRAEYPAMGIDIVDSVTNFYLLKFPDDGDKNSKDAAEFLQQRGIIPRPVGAEGDGNYLRITVGSDEENHSVLAAMKDYMQA
jgi:histidinol-phosphate aminotransferase